jgi:DNA adenine methylase
MIIKPFLRWAGGKNWFIKHLDQLIPPHFNDYFEPFLGGASIFLYLNQNDYLTGDSFLSDSNPFLIKTYKILQQYPSELFDALKKLQNNKETYYKVRSQKYDNEILSAAQFIFLNRTSFNGLYRVNKKGEYNVPYGFKSYSLLFDTENMTKFSSAIKNVRFDCTDFENVKPLIKPRDFVFVDPPYTVAHGKNGFIKYNQKLFAWEDQMRLKTFLDEISERGAYYLLTNASHDSIRELFARDSHMRELERSCVIGSISEKRKKITEYIFTNY